MPKLPDGDRRRLVSIVNLTASQSDGEALNALRAATRIASNAGMTLTEALQSGASAAIDVVRIQVLEADAFERGREQGAKEERGRERRQRRQDVAIANAPPMDPAPTTFSWRDMQQQCAAKVMYLSAREQEFITSLNNWNRGLTPKQSDWLLSIHQRVITSS